MIWEKIPNAPRSLTAVALRHKLFPTKRDDSRPKEHPVINLKSNHPVRLRIITYPPRLPTPHQASLFRLPINPKVPIHRGFSTIIFTHAQTNIHTQTSNPVTREELYITYR